MKYPTLLRILSEYTMEKYLDEDLGTLFKKNPPGLNKELISQLKDRDFEWRGNSKGTYYLLNEEGAPVLIHDSQGCRKGIAYKDEISDQVFGKDAKRLLDLCYKKLA